MNDNQSALGPVEAASGGWPVIHFKDHYGKECSLQMSSLAEYEKPGTSAVWLGIDNCDPKVLARDAAKFGIKTKQTTGWVPYPIPPAVLLSSRMHLNREQVAALIAHLSAWLEQDTFEIDNPEQMGVAE